MDKVFEVLNNVGAGMMSRWSKSVTNWTCICIASSVAFLESIHRNSIEPTVWPYMKKLDLDASESEFGYIQAGQAFTNALASVLSGWMADRIFDTRPQLIIGNFIAIIAVFAYFFVEFDFTSTTGLFITYNLLMGVAFGFLSVYRTFIAMETKEHERSRGFGIVLMAEAMGLLFASLIQLAASLLTYPGWKSIFLIHVNIYTSPVILSLVACLFGYICFHFSFSGKLGTSKSSQPSVSSIEKNFDLKSDLPQKEPRSYDKVAFVVLIMAKIGTGLIMITFTSITTLYAMNVFAWTSREFVIFQSSLMIANGVVSMLIGLGYVFFKIDRKLFNNFGISERDYIIFSFILFFIFFIITYPWWFIEETIPYFHPSDEVPVFNRTMSLILVESTNSTDQFVGCNVDYEWCQFTPRVDVYLYNLCLFLASGLALPLINLNLDILLSKVLGPINQGIQQAVFNVAGLMVNIFGPLAFTAVYEATGPILLWIFEIIISGGCLAMMVVFYKRMISFTQRSMEQK